MASLYIRKYISYFFLWSCISPVLALARKVFTNKKQCFNDIWDVKDTFPRDWSLNFTKNPEWNNKNATLSLKLSTCLQYCGHGFSWYSSEEQMNRILVWLIPLLVLMGNKHLPPLAINIKIFSLLHFVGDPIDSMLSLQHTLAVRRAAYLWAKAEKVDYRHELATVVWAIDSLNSDRFDSVTRTLQPHLSDNNFRHSIKYAAADIHDVTVREITRTTLAILTYLSTIIMTFVKASSDNNQSTTLPGNRVALAMLCSWMIPAVLLSAAAGRFSTSKSSIRSIQRLERHLSLPTGTLVPEKYRSCFHGLYPEREDGPEAASSWSGGTYVFRPSKFLLFRRSARVSLSVLMFPSSLLIFCFALLPVIVAVIIAINISYITPTEGFGCRSGAHLAITTAWILSFLFTTLVTKKRIATGKYLLTIIALKDAIVGPAVLLTISIIYAGLFNSCYCWTNGLNGILYPPLRVDINIEPKLQDNVKKGYPKLVGIGIGVQILIFLLMWSFVWSTEPFWGRINIFQKLKMAWWRKEGNPQRRRTESQTMLLTDSRRESVI